MNFPAPNHFDVVVVGDETELDWIPEYCNFLHAECKSQRDDLKLAEEFYCNPLNVLLQLTQPVREKGLLKRTLDLLVATKKTVVSATEGYDDSWRKIDENGIWLPKKDERVLHHDGVIYAWEQGHVDDIFTREQEHTVVVSSKRFPLIDIDYEGNIPENMNELYALSLLGK